jgi:hypothetical protein
MALIDTSELLSDPDFVDTVQLIRRTSTINNKGRNEVVDAAPVSVLMSVQGPQAEDFRRFPDLAELHGVRAVWFNGIFNMEEDGTYSDIIVWNGYRYQVHKVDEDYSNFGGGHCKAFIVRERAS